MMKLKTSFEDKLWAPTNPYTQAKPHHTHSFNCHRRGGEGCAAPADSYLVFAAHLFGVVEWDVVTRRSRSRVSAVLPMWTGSTCSGRSRTVRSACYFAKGWCRILWSWLSGVSSCWAFCLICGVRGPVELVLERSKKLMDATRSPSSHFPLLLLFLQRSLS